MVTHKHAILALNLSFLNRLHLSEAVLKCAVMFEFRLSVLFNCYVMSGCCLHFIGLLSNIRMPRYQKYV